VRRRSLRSWRASIQSKSFLHPRAWEGRPRASVTAVSPTGVCGRRRGDAMLITPSTAAAAAATANSDQSLRLLSLEM
jgi:hypothetical protein